MNKIWVQSSTELSKPQVVKVDVVPMSDLVDRVKMTISKYEMGAQIINTITYRLKLTPGLSSIKLHKQSWAQFL